jgi:hypothetical protein
MMAELKFGPTYDCVEVTYVGPNFSSAIHHQLFCRYRKIINTISAKRIAAITRQGLIG